MKCDHVCAECGAHEQGNWFDSVAKQLTERKLCHSCDHWTSLVKIAGRADVVRVNGTHYMVGREKVSTAEMRGFAGRKFKIKFADGREAESTNLWCQGSIPDRFRDRLPDNAQFER